MVVVDYDVLPAATDCRTAYAEHAARGAPRTHLEQDRFLQGRVRRRRCGVRQGRARLHEDLWQHRGAGHSIEGRGILADVSDRETQVWASTQKAHDLRYAFADYIHLDENRLRVATPDVGGGFGPKLCVYPEDVAVVAAATLLHRSVKWIEDRREHFTNAVHERDQYWSIEIAADADGRVRGVRGRLIHDVGAYALQDVNLPYNSASTLTGPYMVAGAGHGRGRRLTPTRRRSPRCAAPAIRRPPSPWSGCWIAWRTSSNSIAPNCAAAISFRRRKCRTSSR